MATMSLSQRRWYRRNRPPVFHRPSDGTPRPVSGGKRGNGIVRRTRRGRAIS